MKGKPFTNCIVENGKFKDDMFVNLTICNVPRSPLKEFMQAVVNPSYPSGISEARMPVPKFVCELVYASDFASSVGGDVSWDTRSIV